MNGFLKDIIEELKDVQKELVVVQARLSSYLGKIERRQIQIPDIDTGPEVKISEGWVRITIPDEYPPKTSVYSRITLKNGKISTYGYADARDRWFALLKKAAGKYQGPRIDPAVVYVIYYTPVVCDVTNFTVKFIVDGLMYYGFIACDDNLQNLHAVVQEAVLDKENPRTEIYVFEDKGQLRSIFPGAFSMQKHGM